MGGLEISFELRKRGWTQTRVARTLGVTQSAVHQVIFNRARSRRIRIFIAKILKKEVTVLWNDRPKYFYH
ncbi:MAG: helix-turn-helix domain-containing protein [Nitrospirae bacterium]|nr:helix-turn-helix domain-containing protein [Candidatus Manganitrophaceae bacterium]